MITASEERFLATHAYVPEHLPGYVTAISKAEPHLLGDYVCYRATDFLTFIGYPLRSPFDEQTMLETLRSATSRFRPSHVALTAPAISLLREAASEHQTDFYYRLALGPVSIPPGVQNMVRRGSRELQVEVSREIGEEHTQLIRDSLKWPQLSQEARHILERVPAYVADVPTALVFSARDRTGTLVAFDVAEFAGGEYAFYQFNFRSRARHVPGASDLLLHQVIVTARRQGKIFLNLGLGINEGVAHFKRKWGGVPFLAYAACRYEPAPRMSLDAFLQKL